MRKIIFLLCILMVFSSCKNGSKSHRSWDHDSEQADIRELTGSFMYYADAGVLQTKSELFGVIENETAQELIKRAEPLKDEPTDEVEVTLKVKVTQKPEHEEGWDNRVEIIDIIAVSKGDLKNRKIIKLKSQE